MITIIKKLDPRVLLSTLWIFAILNYLYADVLGLFEKGAIEELMTGSIEGIEFTEGFLLGASVLMETAIVMVLLTRILKYSLARAANIIAGVIHTLAVSGSMFVGSAPTLSYMFFGTIEVVTTIYVIWYAWNWKAEKDY